LTEQLIFELAAPESPSFANFLPGANAEAVAALGALASGAGAVSVVVLWGEAGAGKTHLLRAAVAACGQRARSASFFPEPGALLAHDTQWLGSRALVAVDGLDAATAAAQAHLFTTFNALHDEGGRLLAACRSPLGALDLREDLRTRLGSGLLYEIVALGDADKPAALAAFARQRGFRLGPDVIAYLLAHRRRDMATLMRTLVALDRHSLATKRPVTVPLLRSWLQREIDIDPEVR
jgi:DnaA-homolog protein